MPNSSRLFDVYIAVDWSASARPSSIKPRKDALWVAVGQVHERQFEIEVEYYRTRTAVLLALETVLLGCVQSEQRVLLCFDFAYGYPAGFAEALELTGAAPPWRLIWNKLARMIEDEPNNANNRFSVASLLNAQEHLWSSGPFWGCPAVEQTPTLAATSPSFPYKTDQGTLLENFRWTEHTLRNQGFNPQSVWKLFYQGSVGSQSLVGIPVLHYLRFDPRFEALSHVWPFETGFTAQPIPQTGPWILHAEIWPGVIPFDRSDPIPDRAQVQAIVQWVAERDQAGALGQLFDTPPDVPPEALEAAIQAEGWVLGAGK